MIRAGYSTRPLAVGLARSGGGRAVASEDLAVGAAGFGGAVGVQDEGPAEPVDAHLVVVAAEQDEPAEMRLAAAGAEDDVVDLAAGGGLVAAAGPRAVLIPQDDGAAQLRLLPAGSLSVQAAISRARDSEMSPAAITAAIRPWRRRRLPQPTAAPAAPLDIPVLPISQARADRCPSGSYPDCAVNAERTAALTAVSLACARCSRASISPCACVPSDAQSVAAR